MKGIMVKSNKTLRLPRSKVRILICTMLLIFNSNMRIIVKMTIIISYKNNKTLKILRPAPKSMKDNSKKELSFKTTNRR
jgi:hypothetical protein